MNKNNMKRVLMSVMLVSSMTLSSGAIVAQAYNGTSAIIERTMTNEQLVAATTPILQSYTKDASDKTWVMTKDSKFVIVANEANLKNERLAEIVKLVNSEFMAKQIVSSDAQAMLYNQDGTPTDITIDIKPVSEVTDKTTSKEAYKITIDDNIKTYMETAKTLYDEDLTFNTDQWSADWSANMSGDGVDSNAALAYMGCPWFVYWSLSDAWKGNTILVPTQTKCYWGGTGLAATTDCADTELAAKIMKFFTCDEDGMVAINALNSDYVNNTAAVSKIIEAGTSADGNGYLYPDAGQNSMEFFLPLADGLDASMVTAEDQQILSLMDTQTKAYATGEKDLDTALADLTASIHDTFSYLSAE